MFEAGGSLWVGVELQRSRELILPTLLIDILLHDEEAENAAQSAEHQMGPNDPVHLSMNWHIYQWTGLVAGGLVD